MRLGAVWCVWLGALSVVMCADGVCAQEQELGQGVETLGERDKTQAEVVLRSRGRLFVDGWEGDVRRDEVVVRGRIVAVGEEGIELERVGQRGRVLSWGVVREVRVWGDAGDGLAERYEALREVGDVVWRGLSRVERGDYVMGERALEEVRSAWGLDDGVTGQAVCEGLVRCRLRRGAQGEAMWAWLAWLAIEERREIDGREWVGGSVIDSMGGASLRGGWLDVHGGVIDEQTRLVAGLAPVWLRGVWSDALVGDRRWERFASDDVGGVGGEMARLYRAAAGPVGQVVDEPRAGRDAGVRLVWEMVAAQVGEESQRSVARDRLEARLEDEQTPGWVYAWAGVAVGRSLVLEGEAAFVREGVLALLRVAAEHGREQAYLSGVAIAEAARAMERLGEREGAAVLWADLAARYPEHPAARRRPVGWGEGVAGAYERAERVEGEAEGERLELRRGTERDGVGRKDADGE